MCISKLLAAVFFYLMLTSFAVAENGDRFDNAENAVKVLFPKENYHIWTSVDGDLNNDGIEDVGLMLVDLTAGRKERLVVLSGTSDGKYSLLSVSGDYCGVRYHYNLSISKNSLLVEGVSKLSPLSSVTLQFKYNARKNDLQLVGEEDLISDDENPYSSGRSINYLTKTTIRWSEEKGKRHEVAKKIAVPNSILLNEFDCSNDTLGE